jgi:hypothetical protein
MVPFTLGNRHLHVGKHDHTKPEYGGNPEANVGNVYEHIFFHNTTSANIVAVAPTSVKEGKNPLVNVAFGLYNIYMTKERLDVNTTKSDRSGFAGLLETILRKFRTPMFMMMMAPIAVLYVFCMGVSLSPGIFLFNKVSILTAESGPLIHSVSLGLSMAAGFFLYGFTIIFLVPMVNKLLPLKVKPHRDSWFSISVIPWYYHNALHYLVRYTFLDFITPTPLNKLYFQLMGMKVGKGTMINTSNVSDPCLIELGDYVTIGGSATLVAHYGMKGMLIIDKLVIHDNVTIGMRACIFGDVVIGKNATIKPHDVVLPKSRIPEYNKEAEAALLAIKSGQIENFKG